MSTIVTSKTFRIDQDLPVFDIGARSGLLWSRQGFALAGIGEARRIPIERSAQTPGGFAAAASALAAGADGSDGNPRDRLEGPGTGPTAFAALDFNPDKPGQLIVPSVLIGVNPEGQRWLTISGDEVASLAEALELVDGWTKPGPQPVQATEFTLQSQMAPEAWRDHVVAPATQRIRDGKLTKAVLARELILRTDQPIRTDLVVDRLRNTFPTAALFLVDGFVGASPELLVSRMGDVVRAHPLAGTAARASDPAADQLSMAALLASEKDRWEHRITIDWLLDTLLPFCSYVDAEPEPTILTLANLHHLGTRVEGRLSNPPSSVLELVAALHPTPAVGGDPQNDALALIAELENAERGRYAGPVGWVDGTGNGAFAVSVRSAQVRDCEARLFAGVGVVADSDPESELAETRTKFKAMLGALLVP